MDLYTTSFLLAAPQTASSADLQRLALEIGSREGCLVSVAPEPQGQGWNFLLSGSYVQVMSARGAVLRQVPRKITSRIKLPRSEILDSPLSASCTLKPDIRRRLDEIASQTRAFLSVVNPEGPSSSSGGGNAHKAVSGGGGGQGSDASGSTPSKTGVGDHGRRPSEDISEGCAAATASAGGGNSNSGPPGSGAFGLETERMCEIVLEGDASAVEAAKVRVLVMLDQLSGLHADVCEIDHKLHAIVASRKRCVIQTIQEETGTNIYFPSVGAGRGAGPSLSGGLGSSSLHPLHGGGGYSQQHPHPQHHINRSPVPFPAIPLHHQQQSPHLHHGQQPYPQLPHQQQYGGGGVGFPGQQQPQQPHSGSGGLYPPQHHGHNHHQPYRPGGGGGPPHHNHQPPPHSPHRTPLSPFAPHGSPIPFGRGPSPSPSHSPYPASSEMSASPTTLGVPHGSPLDAIWITGEFFGVQRARDMLYQCSAMKVRAKSIVSRDAAILPRKLDWLLTERLEEIRVIMSDNGTFVAFPAIGSQASLITVFGDQRVNIERTIRSIMQLACQFYVASFWLLPISFDVLMPSATINPAQMQPTLQRIANASGAEIVFKSNCFEMHGIERAVRDAVGMVLELEVIKNFHHEIRFQVELANEHREFISGKKNGKINKIMKMANVKIKFETFNDYNFLMDVAGNDVGALHGLSMLQEELPAEVSFHVPESYHKRIIGVGGKNIQRIMKKYGVYVKFSNAEEFAQLGGYVDNEDNVVARTPGKNAGSLDLLKQAVMELVNPKDKDYTVETISIPRRYHRTLLGEKSIFIHDIEHKTNSVVRFPNKETASDIVTIFGPESQVHIAAAMLLDHVPFEADLHVPYAPDLGRVVSTHDLLQLVERLKRDLQIAIIPPTRFIQGEDSLFKFRCQRSNIDFLGSARDALEEYLVSRKVGVYPSSARARNDSFADAFPHFNSALLPSKFTIPETEVAGVGESLLQRGLRPIPSASDVKALFDAPHGYYGESSSSHATSASYDSAAGESSDAAHGGGGGGAAVSGARASSPTTQTTNGGSGYDSSSMGRAAGRPASTSYARHQLSEFWAPPAPPPQPATYSHSHSHSHSHSSSHRHHAHSSSPYHERTHSSFPVPSSAPPHQLNHPSSPSSSSRPSAADESVLKRGSDPMLASKLRDMNMTASGPGGGGDLNVSSGGGRGGSGSSSSFHRTLSSHRAQSLDMSSLPSLSSSSSSVRYGGGGVPSSPTTSTTGGGQSVPSPPSSAVLPRFPNINGPGPGIASLQASSNASSGGGGGKVVYHSAQSQVDEVARVIQSLELS